MKKFILAGAVAASALAFSAPAFAQSILGDWRTTSGKTLTAYQCGGAYCFRLKTGNFAGRRNGKASGSGNNYKGYYTDPRNGKTYRGTMVVAGSKLHVKGCAGNSCKTQTWKRR